MADPRGGGEEKGITTRCALVSPTNDLFNFTNGYLAATTALQKEEDFAWEDEGDDSAGEADRTETQTPMDPPLLAPTPTVAISEPSSVEKKSSGHGAGAPGSPRESSEDGYDLVSTRSGNASGTALAVPGLASVLEGKEEKSKKPAKKEGEEDSGDSDWE
jgi:hypothetical protein